jgi:hypothetical protein
MTSNELSILFTPILLDDVTGSSTNEDSYRLIKYIINDYIKIFNIKTEMALSLLQDSLGELEINEQEDSKKKIYKHGLQLRKNPLTHKWGKIYLSLEEDKVLIHQSMTDFKKGKKPTSFISLSYAVCDVEDRNGHPYCYSIFSQGKTTLFEAENQQDRIAWVDELKRVISKNFKSTEF